MIGPELWILEESPRPAVEDEYLKIYRVYMSHTRCPRCGEDRFTGWSYPVFIHGYGHCPPCRVAATREREAWERTRARTRAATRDRVVELRRVPTREQ